LFNFVPNNLLVTVLENANSLTVTENFALTYKSTLNYLLDFFGNAGGMRNRSESDIISLFTKAFAEDRLLALKTLFYIRDVRGGQGERRTFRVILHWLANNYSDIVKKNLLNVPFYGRWDDLFSLFGTPLETETLNVIKKQLDSDYKIFLEDSRKPDSHEIELKNTKSISLLAKWLPSINTSSKKTIKLGYKIQKFLGLTPKEYRKILASLRRYIDVVEVKMCARDWNHINFEHIPSKAILTYRKAFERRASDAYNAYLGKVEKGESKINASAVFPYNILQNLIQSPQTEISIKSADIQWKALPNFLDGDKKGLVIADTSGSMSGLPLYIAVSLAIYFSERNIGPFKDVFITFSKHPRFHRLVGNNLLEKWNNLDRDGWELNTDLQAALDLILTTANNVTQKDMPSMLFIISDMEFDYACSAEGKSATNFEVMKEKFKNAGYKLPNVIWWTVNNRQNNVPVKFSETGVALVSGSHPSILKKITSTESLNPLSLMLETILDKRYNAITV
jgi:hypothetical protein